MGATASRAQTSFTFLLVATQPLAECRPRDPEAATHCAGITERAIRLHPAAPLALCAILVLDQLGEILHLRWLWDFGEREALSISSTVCQIR